MVLLKIHAVLIGTYKVRSISFGSKRSQYYVLSIWKSAFPKKTKTVSHSSVRYFPINSLLLNVITICFVKCSRLPHFVYINTYRFFGLDESLGWRKMCFYLNKSNYYNRSEYCRPVSYEQNSVLICALILL